MATIIGGVTIRIGATVKQLEYDLKKAERSLKASADRFKSIGANLSLGVTAPILALGAKALSVTGDIEALQKGLISVMGSAKAAGDEFERLKEVAKLALARKTGARGLRSILENLLLDTMYELPSQTDVKKVTINADVVAGKISPLVTHSAS